MERIATTPFGGGRFGARNFAFRAEMEARQARLAGESAGNETGRAEKWQIIRALTEARDIFGLSDRSITVLEALISFHQDRTLDGRAAIVVFPSNAELSLRTRGMSPATLRRHLAALVETGMILRRDSPNGKRFCRRDDRGQVESAFGFDLAPLALRADEIFAEAERVREAARRVAKLRAEITLHLRDISRTITMALTEERAGDWSALAERLAGLSGRVLRNGPVEGFTLRCEALVRLRAEVENAYLNSLSEQEMSANDSDSERHIQNSNTEPHFEINGKEHNSEAKPGALERKSVGIGLKEFLKACPQIADYGRGGMKSWSEVIAAADIVRSMLGVSPSAWDEAKAAMGDIAAAVTMAAILERAEGIRSAGGYLRDLTEKARRGQFSVRPMLKALQ